MFRLLRETEREQLSYLFFAVLIATTFLL